MPTTLSLPYFAVMAGKALARTRLTPADHKRLMKLGAALGESDPSVKLVTYEPDDRILAVYVDAAEDKSAHELAVIDVWLAWLSNVDDRVEFQLLNLSEVSGEWSRSRMMAAHQGEVLFDRR
ncbi:MAG: hypothetical protein ACRDF8_05405 [Chloroflexota bacterium]